VTPYRVSWLPIGFGRILECRFGGGSQQLLTISRPEARLATCLALSPLVGVIVLSAKMAKADGIVAADEVKAFKEAFRVSATEMKQVAPVFNSQAGRSQLRGLRRTARHNLQRQSKVA
jgi:tellurite resistance protein TerB